MAADSESNSIEQDVADAQQTLRQAGASTGEAAADLVGVASEQLAAVSVRLRALRDEAVTSGKAAAAAADTYVHDQPWHTALTAACVGLAVGLLISRR